MPSKPSPFPQLRRRLEAAEDRAQRFQVEGLPIPTGQLLTDFEQAVRAGDVERAEGVVKRAETLLARADQDWGWLGELLTRVDGLRGIADTVGLDLARIDARVGNPRAQLLSEPLTPASIEKAAAGASFALAVLNDAIPKYIVAEAQALGMSIRRARDRGEDVREAVTAFTALLRSVQGPVLSATAEHLVETRRAVARIPRAPAIAAVSEQEEDEILREARNLARRLHRIKTRAHDATDAVRLISQVRQALSEDRRYLSPEEEVEALWAEVDRMAKEKRLATAGPGAAPEGAEAPGAEGPEEAYDEERPTVVADLLTTPVKVVEPPPPPRAVAARPGVAPTPLPVPGGRATVARIPLPIVPPMKPLPDEQAGEPRPQSPDTLSEGAGPRIPRPTRIAIASAYVPPEISLPAAPVPAPVPAPPPETVESPVPEAPTPMPAPASAPATPAPPSPPPATPEATPSPTPSPPAEKPAEGGILPPPATATRRIRSRHRES